MRLNLHILFLLLICSLNGFGQEAALFKKVKDLEILKVTRNDILRLFGQPKDSDFQYYRVFELNEGRIDVEYSAGSCSKTKMRGWNVPEFTVTRIFLTFNKQVSPKQINLDLSSFHKSRSSDVPNAFGFENELLGMNVDITSRGNIEIIAFYPKQKYEDLYCQEK